MELPSLQTIEYEEVRERSRVVTRNVVPNHYDSLTLRLASIPHVTPGLNLSNTSSPCLFFPLPTRKSVLTHDLLTRLFNLKIKVY